MPPDGKHTDNDEQRWRALAQEARQQASLMTDPDARRIMRSIADRYDRLAERAKLKRNASNPD